MTPQSLRAVADWNAERGCELYRWSAHEKNAHKLEQMLKDYARYIYQADTLRRIAWAMEHTFRPRTRHRKAA